MGRLFVFGEDAEPKPSFLNSCVLSLKETVPQITEETMREYLESRKSGCMTNALIHEAFEQEIANKISYKIKSNEEKIESLQGIFDDFQKELEASQPKRLRRFKLEYPFLEDMFDEAQ